VATRVPRGRLLGGGTTFAAFVCLAALFPSGAAAAHGGSTVPDAAYFRAELSDMQPSPEGVTAHVDPAGEWIEIVSTGPGEIIVLGYTKEPYLRLKDGVVEENQVSPTTFLNRSLFADSLPDPQDNANLAPVWRQVATNGVARWHDHRIHWMGSDLPPQVRADPSHAHRIGDWVVHASADGVAFEIRGTLGWIGKPSSMPTWAWALEILGIAVLGVGLVASLRKARPAGGRSPNPETAVRGSRPDHSGTREHAGGQDDVGSPHRLGYSPPSVSDGVRQRFSDQMTSR
jgi:hypothetical protein